MFGGSKCEIISHTVSLLKLPMALLPPAVVVALTRTSERVAFV